MESRKIKVLMLVAILAGTTMLAGLPSTLADSTDTFTITVTGQYIVFTVNNETWSVNGGTPVAMSHNYYTNTSKTFIADSTGSSVNVDIKLRITTDGTNWNAATEGNDPASNTYRLGASIDTWSSSHQIVTAGTTTIDTGHEAGTQKFDLEFMSPTSTTTGSLQTITVTASAIAS
jgi:hypothetical protein